ncbi:hypothetical protein KIN20_013029 [Parelaphostrongylus tenuis]|uniref:Uncharacterized protein n=1 Tax=Parelaphostrongylus tenuis TaxID=148309 RepID=A0AAD5N1N2_PARTN|nr:hypothetical protein KIN20_013029 [Parelaphostrongylus tenuis]
MMSSSEQAETDLSVSLPSCSQTSTTLDIDVLITIFEKAASIGNIRHVLTLATVSPWATSAIHRSLARQCHIRVDIREPIEYRIVGLKEEKLPVPEPVIYIQGSRVTPKAATELMAFLIDEMKEIREVSLNIEDPDLTTFNMLLDQLINADNVKLEVLRIRRRKGGQTFQKVSELVMANLKTLRIVGRIGLTEALVLDSSVHLERLSLMMFDLGLEVSQSMICDHLLRIASSGATFKHLSYTGFIGLDPTNDVVQSFLDRCGVNSLRLTMMLGPLIPPQPDYMIGKVRHINRLELGEVVDKPNIFNSLITYESVFKKVFPNVDDIHYFQHW